MRLKVLLDVIRSNTYILLKELYEDQCAIIYRGLKEDFGNKRIENQNVVEIANEEGIVVICISD